MSLSNGALAWYVWFDRLTTNGLDCCRFIWNKVLGPLPSIVQQGLNGVVFAPGDPQSLLAAVRMAWETAGELVAAGKLSVLSVFGNDWPTLDGTGVRDYIHVSDLANGHKKALEKLSHAAGVFTYNLGTGRGYSVLEMIAALERATGQPLPYRIAGRREGDIALCFANINLAKAELGWVATHGLDEMCCDLWRWQQYCNKNVQ